MAVKTTTKEKVVHYEEVELFCDLCDEAIPTDHTCITIKPAVCRGNGNKFEAGIIHLTVCSSECLTKNVGAVTILLDTKLNEQVREEHSKSKDNKDMMNQIAVDDYKKYAQDNMAKGWGKYEDFAVYKKIANKFLDQP